MEKMKTSKSVFYLTAGYLWLAILWTFYRLWGQSLLYGALPELPAALAEGGIKLLIYGLPVLLLVKGRKSELVSPPEKWLQMNRETIFVGLGGGAFFLLASAIGMLRLPDFYCRLHASGNSETLGVMLSFMGLVIYEGLTLTSLKMIMIFLLI